jgi:spermidine/putrescine-binding protein
LLVLIGVLGLAVACGGGPAGGPSGSGEPTANEGELQLAPELSVYNWADYIDEQVLGRL